LKQHADKLLLGALATPAAVGLFSAAYKFVEAMTPFTVNLTLPLFPVFSRIALISPRQLFESLERSLKFLYVLGTPLAILLFCHAERIVALFFGQAYQEAAFLLRLLAPAVLLLLPTSIYGYTFTALGRQRLYTICVALSLATNLVVDLLLIPFYGPIGAALGTLAAEGVLFGSGLIMLSRLGGGLAGVRLLWRPAVAGLVLGCFCWLGRNLPWSAAIPATGAGLAAYMTFLMMLRTFTPEERTILRHAMRMRLGGAIQ